MTSADSESASSRPASRANASGSSGQLAGWASLLVVAAFGALALRYFAFVAQHGATLLVQDQWDYLGPHFLDRPAWELFWHQHGPVRQGLGALLIDGALRVSLWDGVAIAMLTGSAIALAGAVALWLKRRLFGSLEITDVIIPLVFLSVAQHEALVTIPNPSHGAVPLLLLMLYGVLLARRPTGARDAALLGAHAALVFTGFGFFAGLITPLVILAERGAPGRRMGPGRLSALLGCALAPLGIFFVGWDPGSSTAACTPSNAAEWLRVPLYIALPFARALGLPASGPALVVALGIPVAMAWALVVQLVARRRGAADPARVVTAVLLAFALLFGGAVALGRACLVTETTHQSRYVPLVIPGFLGLYFACTALRSPRLRGALRWALVLAFAVAEIAGRGQDLEEARRGHRNKVRWAACMVTRSDLDACTRRVGFRIHPYPRRAGIPAKLAFLERGALNLYHPALQRRLLMRARELRPPPASSRAAPLQPAPLRPAPFRPAPFPPAY